MYDWLLFLHLIAAFLLAVTVVVYSAVALGAAAPGRTLFVADRCWDVGGLGTLLLGIWLALYLDEYDFFDGWIIGAIVLWFVATGLGQSLQRRTAAGESALFGSLVLVATALAGSDLRLGYRALLIGAIPSWIVMRVGAQWIASKEHVDDIDPAPAWVGIGYGTSEGSFLLLIIATV